MLNFPRLLARGLLIHFLDPRCLLSPPCLGIWTFTSYLRNFHSYYSQQKLYSRTDNNLDLDAAESSLNNLNASSDCSVERGEQQRPQLKRGIRDMANP
jgi:hypothetical protein